MRHRLVLALVVGLLTITATPRAASAGENTRTHFSFDQFDKQEHLLGSFVLTVTGGLIYEHQAKLSPGASALLAVATTLVLATIKERFLDSVYSPGDQVADVIGATAGGVTFYVAHF